MESFVWRMHIFSVYLGRTTSGYFKITARNFDGQWQDFVKIKAFDPVVLKLSENKDSRFVRFAKKFFGIW